jgi:hypothetical protein
MAANRWRVASCRVNRAQNAGVLSRDKGGKRTVNEQSVKKLLLTFGVLAAAASLQATTYYVATNGSDSNNGTNLATPFANPQTAVALAGAGDTVYIRGGTYTMTAQVKPAHAGTAASYGTLSAYPGEQPVWNFSGITVDGGLYFSKDYWHAIGITVENCSGHGIVMSGAGFTILEGCASHDNQDDGIYITGGGHDGLILNCDSYRNYKAADHGQDGDGFSMKTGNGPRNVYRGCRAFYNADDGYDFYDDTTNYVVLDHCWTFRNGLNLWNDPAFAGNGNGFKLGGAGTKAAHLVMNCLAFENRVKGFDQNNAVGGMTLYNCTGFSNECDFWFPDPLSAGTNVFINNLAYIFVPGGVNSCLTNIQPVGLIMQSNSWQGFNVTAADFASLDTSSATNARNASFSLPNISFFHLATGSDLIDAGVNVGLPYSGAAPDIGAFEYTNGSTITQGSISFNNPGAGWNSSGFQLTLSGLSGHGPVVFFVSTNLVSWTPIYTNPATSGSLTYTDPATNGNQQRFYRAQEQ